jgi:hypothetical protein
MSDLRPWHRQPGESMKAFHAFCHYRDLPMHDRSLDKAFRACQVACLKKSGDPQTIPRANKRWKDWRRQWNWEARAEAHDAEVAEAERVKRVKEIAAMNERHAAIAARDAGQGHRTTQRPAGHRPIDGSTHCLGR